MNSVVLFVTEYYLLLKTLCIDGTVFFAVVPALEKESLGRALLWGCLYGFFTYATYDLTNMATIENWPLKVVIVDIMWGGGSVPWSLP